MTTNALPAHVEAELARVVAEINASDLVPPGYRVELCRDPLVMEPIYPPDRLVQGGWCAPGFDLTSTLDAIALLHAGVRSARNRRWPSWRRRTR